MPFALEHLQISSSQGSLVRRQVTVCVPAAAREAGRPLPLLVLHDGQNVFEPDRAHVAGQHWRAAETADDLIDREVIPPLVIAAIDHAGDERASEYTPTPGGRQGAGGAADYGRFVMEDILPRLAGEFGVRHDAAGVAMGGASLGGLVTLSIARQYPDRIGRLLLMSPSVWWDRRVILRRLQRVGLRPRPRVWLDIGRHEGTRSITDARALRDVLRRQTTALNYLEDPDGHHTECDWARRLPAALAWLFAPSQPSHLQMDR